jgi:hypothetical protein
MSVFWRMVVAFRILTTEAVHLSAQWPPGLWWGAVGGLAYALAEFLVDYQDVLPERRQWGLYLVQALVRVILGAVVGAGTLALGDAGGFVAGLAGPAALVALGAKFGSRKPRASGKEAVADADDRPNPKRGT